MHLIRHPRTRYSPHISSTYSGYCWNLDLSLENKNKPPASGNSRITVHGSTVFRGNGHLLVGGANERTGATASPKCIEILATPLEGGNNGEPKTRNADNKPHTIAQFHISTATKTRQLIETFAPIWLPHWPA